MVILNLAWQDPKDWIPDFGQILVRLSDGGYTFSTSSFSLKKPVIGCNKDALLPRNMVPKVSD